MVSIVLVVDDDERARRLVRMGLELEGVAVVEAESVNRAAKVIHRNVTGVVLDRQLPDGDGLDLLPVIGATCPDARIVIHSTITDGREPAWIPKVDKGDLPGIVQALEIGITAPSDDEPARLAVVDLVRAEADAVARDWEELCRWDPLLPPDTQPPLARVVVDAVAEALQRPQPLGWGPDPALTKIAEAFAESAGAIDVAIGQLVCLREAFRRHVAGHVPPGEESESTARVDMVIDRAIWTAARVTAARLARQLQIDPTTGLGDRHAFDRDAERELQRAVRYERPLTLAVVDLDSPDETQVRRAATALATNVRAQDLVYRTGPSTFTVVAAETSADAAMALAARIRRFQMPGVRVGHASYPGDGDDIVSLVHEAERRVSSSV